MLNSSLRLVQGMGGKAVPPESAGTKDECVVGNARLGLWLGERLLGAASRFSFFSRFGEKS